VLLKIYGFEAILKQDLAVFQSAISFAPSNNVIVRRVFDGLNLTGSILNAVGSAKRDLHGRIINELFPWDSHGFLLKKAIL